MRKKVKKTKDFNWVIFSFFFLICFLFTCLAYAHKRGIFKGDTVFGSFMQQTKDSTTKFVAEEPTGEEDSRKIESISSSGCHKYIKIGCFFLSLVSLIWKSYKFTKTEHFSSNFSGASKYHASFYYFRRFVCRKLFYYGCKIMLGSFSCFLIAFLLKGLAGFDSFLFFLSSFLFFSSLPYLIFTLPLMVVFDLFMLGVRFFVFVPNWNPQSGGFLWYLMTYYSSYFHKKRESDIYLALYQRIVNIPNKLLR